MSRLSARARTIFFVNCLSRLLGLEPERCAVHKVFIGSLCLEAPALRSDPWHRFNRWNPYPLALRL